MTNRRSFLLGIGAALAAPAIVRAESIMKVAVLRESLTQGSLERILMQLAPRQPLCTTFPSWQLMLYDAAKGFHVVNLSPEDVYV